MKILLKEINYKEIDVPIDTTIFDLQEMIKNSEVIVADTLDCEYYAMFPENEDYEKIY